MSWLSSLQVSDPEREREREKRDLASRVVSLQTGSQPKPDFPLHDVSVLTIFFSLSVSPVAPSLRNQHFCPPMDQTSVDELTRKMYTSLFLLSCQPSCNSMRFQIIRRSLLSPLMFFKLIPKIFQCMHYFRFQLVLQKLPLQRC